MRTKRLLWALGVVAPSALAIGACGDDGTSGGGGQGGAGGGTTKATTGVTTSSTSSGLGGGDPDSCPGTQVTLSPGDEVSIPGSTTDLANDFDVFCAPGSTAPDAVYAVEFPAACSFVANLVGSNGLNPALSLRYTQCNDRIAGDLCEPSSAPIARHQEPGTLWVVVDGVSNSSGDYELNLSCTAPACQDGVLNPGEQCDFGPDEMGDTCAADCTVEDAEAADQCSDIVGAFPLPQGTTIIPPSTPWFDTSGADPNGKGSCIPGGEPDGPDEIFAFVPDVSGTLTIETALDLNGDPVCVTFMEPECWFSFLWVREGDCMMGTEVACGGIDPDPMSPTGGQNQITFPVTAGTTYYLYVDGLNTEFFSQGPYTLHFNLQ